MCRGVQLRDLAGVGAAVAGAVGDGMTLDSLAGDGLARLGELRESVRHFALASVEPAGLFPSLEAKGLPPPRRCAVRGPAGPIELLVAQHFPLRADAVSCDDQLGTLALVHLPPADAGPSRTEEDIRRRLEEHIDAAAYLRHLLLEALRPESGQQGRAAYLVEVVFMAPRAA